MDIKIIDFRLFGYRVADCQTITGGDSIKIVFEIKAKNIDSIQLDISHYSQKGKVNIPINTKKGNVYYEGIFDVDFLGETGIECGRNDVISQIKAVVYIDNKEYIYNSNAIGNATYESFKEEEHHLGVYSTNDLGKTENLKKLREISQNNIYKNDIIFIDRYLGNDYFIDINKETQKNIVIKTIEKIKEKHDFIVIYSSEDNFQQYSKIIPILEKLLKLKKYIKIYFYNIPFCIFKAYGQDFIDEHILYNAIYRVEKGYDDFGICNSCSYNKLCNRIHTQYQDKYGLSEFNTF